MNTYTEDFEFGSVPRDLSLDQELNQIMGQRHYDGEDDEEMLFGTVDDGA
jgi:hypothetical protein